uniref:Flagellar transcriptional regulator FlhC n=1 Tax=mine drainage metagenome TaxID=410659 RepID=E6QMW5_9ZZZZ
MARKNQDIDELGAILARLGARAGTIYSVLSHKSMFGRRATPPQCREIYLDINGHASHSGLMPSNDKWYFENGQRIVRSSRLLYLAWLWRDHGVSQAYMRSMLACEPLDLLERPQKQIVSADRAWYLISHMLPPMITAQKMKNITPQIRLLACRSCGNPTIARPENRIVICPVCATQKDRNAK